MQVSITTLEYFPLSFNTFIEVRFAIKKKSTGENCIFLMREINIRNGFLIILGTDSGRAIPKTPIYYIFWINIFCVFIKSYWAEINAKFWSRYGLNFSGIHFSSPTIYLKFDSLGFFETLITNMNLKFIN